MRRAQLLTLAIPLLASLSCNDVTAPPSPASREIQLARHALVIPSTTAQLTDGYYHTCALKTDGTVTCWGYDAYGQATVPAGLASVAQLSAGGFHNCAVKTDGTVACWGYDASGQATVPDGLASVEQVSDGLLHSCALKTDGTVVCWGNNDNGQATVPDGLASVVQLSAGYLYTCALKTDGTVVCWGDNGYGQATVPDGLVSVAQVSAGTYHTCALKTNGSVVCWGTNGDGQATAPEGLGPVGQVSAGGAHTCALETGGTLVCWGQNGSGQATVPAGLGSVAQVSAGAAHTCALKTDGTVVCWGANDYGQASVPDGLNLNSATNTTVSSAPAPSSFDQAVTFTATVTKTSDASAITTGTVSFIEGGTCASPIATHASGTALNGSGQAMFSTSALAVGGHTVRACYSGAFGFNQSEGSDTQTVNPVLVIPSTMPQVSAGYYHTCALKNDGTVVCWGRNDFGQSTEPDGLSSVAQVSGGGVHTCALKTDGTVVCWGYNFWGQVAVPGGLAPAVQVSLGGDHTCAVTTDGSVVCWGYNAFDQSTVPAGVGSVTQVSAGAVHTCALKIDRTVACWGQSNEGQATVPDGLVSVSEVSVGGYHSCALKTDGTAICWGRNAEGQATVPGGLVSIAQVSAGSVHTCALKTGGTVVCWGDNSYGQATVPDGLSSVTKVSTGFHHSCALKTDGAVVCWGENNYGQTTVPDGLNLVGNAAQSITFISTPPIPALTGGTYTVSATGGASGSPVVFSSLNASICTVSGSIVSLNAVGICNVAADQVAGNGYDAAPQVTQGFQIGSSAQSITFTSQPPSPALTGGGYIVAATGGDSGSPITFSSLTASVCVVSGSGVHFIAAGQCTIAADQAGGNGYDAAPQQTQSFTIGSGLAAQSITFTSQPPRPALTGGAYTVTATGGGSGYPVTFGSLTASVCKFSANNTVSFYAVGTCTIAADQAGGPGADGKGYDPAPQQTQSFTIGPGLAAQSITFTSTPPSPALTGGTYTVTATGGGSGYPVTFSSLTASVCKFSANNTVSFYAVGTCTIAADQAGGPGADGKGYSAAPQQTQGFQIGSAGQSISFTSQPPIPALTGGTYTVSATGGASKSPVTFSSLTASVCTVSGSNVSLNAVGPCTVAADQAAGNGYSAAPQQTQGFQIGSAAQSITFTSTPPSPALTGGTYTVTATGGASKSPVTFSSLTASVCTVSGSTVSLNAVGPCTVAADQAAGNGYDAAPQVKQGFSIGSSAQSITFTSTPPSPALTGGTYNVSATGGASGSPVTFSSLTASVCTVSGSSVSLVAVGSCNVAANQAAGNGYNAAPQVAQTFTVYGTQTVSFTSTPPSPAQFGRSYTPAARGGASGNAVLFTTNTSTVCTIANGVVSLVGRGSCMIAANQAAGGNYLAAAEQTQTFTVTAATTSTTVSVTPVTQQYSDKVTLSATTSPATLVGSNLTGTVQFKIDGVNAGAPQTLSGSGTATVNYSLIQASGSSPSLTASFTSTNPNFGSSASGGVTFNVTKEDAVIAPDGSTPSFRTGRVSLGFTVREASPDLGASMAAPGDISLAGLSVTLIPQKKGGSAVSLTCGAGTVSGTGYSGVHSFTCVGSNIPTDNYQVIASVTGLYFIANYNGQLKPGQ